MMKERFVIVSKVKNWWNEDEFYKIIEEIAILLYYNYMKYLDNKYVKWGIAD